MTTTVTRTIGVGGDYSTLQSWEDGAPASLTTAAKYTCASFSGAFTQRETVTGGTSGKTALVMDTDNSTYMVLADASGTFTNGETLTGGTSGKTCAITTPATDSGGMIWQGKIKSSTDVFTLAGVDPINLQGSTNSATCYKTLTTAAGASFRDHVNAQTNELRYNSANGCAIINTSGYGRCVVCNETNCSVSNIQMSASVGNSTAIETDNGQALSRIDNSIIESNGRFYCTQVGSMYNCLVIKRGTNSGHAVQFAGLATLVNVTVVWPSDMTNGTTVRGITTSYIVGGSVIENCCVFGFPVAINSITSITCSTNVTDLTSPGAGWTGGVAYDTSTGSGFQNITDATRDYRIKSTSALKDAGTTDSTNAATDIVKTARPQGSAYDVGAWEFVVASATAVSWWAWNKFGALFNV